jgi:hypothetical protein
MKHAMEQRSVDSASALSEPPDRASGERGMQSARPHIVCLCGSTRFPDAFMAAQFAETIAGKIVLTVGCFPRNADGSWDRMKVTHEQKIALDVLHKQKIDLADEVFIVNVGGYIGDSTRSEIAHAVRRGKPIRWLEPEHAMPLAVGHDARSEPRQNETNAVAVRMREALAELVRLKKLKESVEPPNFEPDIVRRRAILDEYERCKPLAWKAAFAIVEPK